MIIAYLFQKIKYFTVLMHIVPSYVHTSKKRSATYIANLLNLYPELFIQLLFPDHYHSYKSED